MIENYFELKKSECQALRKIIELTLPDYDKEHNNSAVTYLKEREKKAENNITTIGESFVMSYYYWTIDRDERKFSNPRVVRESLYLTSTGFYKRFHKWYNEAFDRVMKSFNELNGYVEDSEADYE